MVDVRTRLASEDPSTSNPLEDGRWFAAMQIPTAVVNGRGVVQVANPAFCQAIGHHEQVLVGSWLTEWLALVPGAVVDLPAPPGQRHRAQVVISAIDLDRTLVQLVDVERQHQLIDHLTTLTTTDALTGLLNRRGVFDRIDDHLAGCRRRGVCGGVLLIDLDRLKLINDRHGHQVGDLVIAAVGEAIAQPLAEIDAAGRIGGDEFAVLIGRGAAGRVRQMSAAITESVARCTAPLTGRIGTPVTVSIGAALVARTHGDATSLLDDADRAMYRCKHHRVGAA